MATALIECEVCLFPFDSENRSPLSLPCGHSFCCLCVTQIDADRQPCPNCRNDLNTNVDQLPKNYLVISHNSKASGSISEKCKKHGYLLECLCIACEEIVCRKCSRDAHVGHRIEYMEDIAGFDETTDDVRQAFHSKLQCQFDLCESLFSASNKMKTVLNEVKEVSNIVDQWNDEISNKKSKLQKIIEKWDEQQPIQASAFKKMLADSNDPLPEEPNMAQMKMKLEQLHKQTAVLEVLVSSNPGESSLSDFLNPSREDLHDDSGNASGFYAQGFNQQNLSLIQRAVDMGLVFANDVEWCITSTSEAEKAMVSHLCGQKATTIKVVSCPAKPIANLPQFLHDIVHAGSEGISLVPLKFFWGMENEDERLNDFVSQYRNQLQMLYGPTNFIFDVLYPGQPPLFSENGHQPLVRGIALASMEDVELSSSLPIKPSAVCCLKSLPAEAGDQLKKLKWIPNEWHFPLLKDRDLDWMFSIMQPSDTSAGQRCLYLPQCYLTEDGFRILLNRAWYGWGKFTLLCEPQGLSVEAAARLSALAEEKTITVRCSISVENLF